MWLCNGICTYFVRKEKQAKTKTTRTIRMTLAGTLWRRKDASCKIILKGFSNGYSDIYTWAWPTEQNRAAQNRSWCSLFEDVVSLFAVCLAGQDHTVCCTSICSSAVRVACYSAADTMRWDCFGYTQAAFNLNQYAMPATLCMAAGDALSKLLYSLQMPLNSVAPFKDSKWVCFAVEWVLG